mmetsp:Transcript_20445/g.60820  ORF Transcript_20445/g.60820 Transcript_20445/m.60820 type:complete len:394 (+) Transcript_20445:523-1704(+)
MRRGVLLPVRRPVAVQAEALRDGWGRRHRAAPRRAANAKAQARGRAHADDGRGCGPWCGPSGSSRGEPDLQAAAGGAGGDCEESDRCRVTSGPRQAVGELGKPRIHVRVDGDDYADAARRPANRARGDVRATGGCVDGDVRVVWCRQCHSHRRTSAQICIHPSFERFDTVPTEAVSHARPFSAVGCSGGRAAGHTLVERVRCLWPRAREMRCVSCSYGVYLLVGRVCVFMGEDARPEAPAGRRMRSHTGRSAAVGWAGAGAASSGGPALNLGLQPPLCRRRGRWGGRRGGLVGRRNYASELQRSTWHDGGMLRRCSRAARGPPQTLCSGYSACHVAVGCRKGAQRHCFGSPVARGRIPGTGGGAATLPVRAHRVRAPPHEHMSVSAVCPARVS